MNPDELRAARKTAGMTQQQLADAIGMHRETVSDMERGSAPIEKRTAIAVEHVTMPSTEKLRVNLAGQLRVIAVSLVRFADALEEAEGS